MKNIFNPVNISNISHYDIVVRILKDESPYFQTYVTICM